MDPSKREEEEAARKDVNASQKRDENKREAADDEDGDNQLDDESKNEMVKRGAVGRRFAVVNLPALEQLAIDDAEKS